MNDQPKPASAASPEVGDTAMLRGDIPMLPSGCGYQGYEFGAPYPDSACYGGRLYDADSCDGEGNLYEPAEYIPCPMCHPRLAVRFWAERYELGGAAKDDASAAAVGLVADIRRNRKNGTEPWKRPARPQDSGRASNEGDSNV